MSKKNRWNSEALWLSLLGGMGSLILLCVSIWAAFQVGGVKLEIWLGFLGAIMCTLFGVSLFVAYLQEMSYRRKKRAKKELKRQTQVQPQKESTTP